jgi:predicted O-methyltransferase YrrM
MKNYIYTENWFSSDGLGVLNNIDISKEIHMLEIGSFEGKSTVWYLENILKNPKSTITCVDPWENYSQDNNTFDSYNSSEAEWKFGDLPIEANFLHNIKESGKSNQVIIKKGYSQYMLSALLLENKKYDIIFIDGNHTAPFVLSDSVLSWHLTKKDSIIIFDDYLGGEGLEDTLKPEVAIDSFLYLSRNYIEVLYDSYRKIIKRTK